jgi:predicted MPP superfamily phosphohydrolase
MDNLAVKLKNLQPRLGKYAVMGNHEVYGGVKNTIKFIRDSGFILLRGSGVAVEDTINIAGMDFTGGEVRRYSKQYLQKPEREILSGLPSGLFTLLLKHRSDVENESLGMFDLQLSGHTHKGQIFPMNLATMFLFQHHSGFAELAKGSAIYVSRGTGTAGPPVRFLSTPEITIIDIVSA